MAGIREDVEKRVYAWISEVGERIGPERLSQIFEGAVTGAARTKRAVDDNLETLLAMANIPSRREYQRMQAKLDALQGSVMSLTRTVERLREHLAGRNGHAGPTAAARKRATKPKASRSTSSTSKKRSSATGSARTKRRR